MSSNRKLDEANASPTKDFFVSMLTRDISLVDAILDLVDNSLDGVLRSQGENPEYEGYFAKITFDSDHFSIEDNCGGLARDIAIKYAFKMGRDPRDHRDDEVETIGMYGIGMKRAMFKMGRDCRVITQANKNDHYQVVMGEKWLKSPAWNKLPLEPVPQGSRLPKPGTRIVVGELRPGIVATFSEPSFSNDLRRGLSEHFARFLQRGFDISVNGKRIDPVRIELLHGKGADGIKPYFMHCQVGGTQIRIMMGLNPRARATDKDEVLALPGWSVFCNDRAVLVGDTTKLTGWGERPVPRYHDQYDILTGIVEFRAKEAIDLPVTTTKRDLDAASEAWLTARSYMIQATRKFVDHTNYWKNNRSEHRETLAATKALKMEEVWTRFEAGADKELLRKQPGAEVWAYNPERSLPKPDMHTRRDRKVTFLRPERKVRRLAEVFFDDAKASPNEVGASSFDFAYKELVGTKT